MRHSYNQQINRLAKKFNLPPWWVQSVIIEYFPCRKFLENESLWSFDFSLVDDKLIRTLPQKHVVIPEYLFVQNIKYRSCDSCLKAHLTKTEDILQEILYTSNRKDLLL
jgi:hypothetical protein